MPSHPLKPLPGSAIGISCEQGVIHCEKFIQYQQLKIPKYRTGQWCAGDSSYQLKRADCFKFSNFASCSLTVTKNQLCKFTIGAEAKSGSL